MNSRLLHQVPTVPGGLACDPATGGLSNPEVAFHIQIKCFEYLLYTRLGHSTLHDLTVH